MCTEGASQPKAISTQVADVHKALLSLSRCADMGFKSRFGSAYGCLLDTVTGEVITMVSMPSYDPNAFSDGISHTEWNALTGDEMNPLLNKSIQGLYPPGSTFKPVTALAALAGGVDPTDRVVCNGGYYLGRHRFACWKRGGHGYVDLNKSLYQSCNVYYYTYTKHSHRLKACIKFDIKSDQAALKIV